MKTPREKLSCDPGRIEQWLAGGLSPDEQSQLESHLDECTSCRCRLEAAAAEPRYWEEASVHLQEDALDDGMSRWTGCSDSSSAGADASNCASRIIDYFDPTDDPRMLGRFGGYEIVGIVGCGGMSVVLKGFEGALDRYIAIKLLAPHLATSGAARARFAREARAAAAVLHENVVPIHSVSEAKGLPFLVMPYMPGESLQKRLDERGPMQLNEILRIGRQIAAGLAAAHAQGLVHRDIKPGNILLDRGVERVTITDFGLARAADDASLTRSGVIAGTPQYMSPEQGRGEPLDARSDLFSLGTVLYSMCVGRPPFRAETAFGTLQRICNSAPTPIREVVPETPEWLCEIIAKLHAKDAAERFQSSAEVAEYLGSWLAHIQQPAIIPAPPRASLDKRRAKRRRRLVTALGIGVVAICVAAVSQVRLAKNAGDGRMNRIGTASPAIGVVEQGNNFSIRSALDDRALWSDIETTREQISQIETEWTQNSSSGNGSDADSDISETHRRLDELGERIEQYLP
jgi:eukaryotic-like serine/threonine-protein kinase